MMVKKYTPYGWTMVPEPTPVFNKDGKVMFSSDTNCSIEDNGKQCFICDRDIMPDQVMVKCFGEYAIHQHCAY